MEPAQITPPDIDYLAKDFASFRRLMLDHLQVRIPDWNESSAADLGNALIDVLAYAADYASYYQDAVATEAYLGTARRRRSIKRHARLLDYIMHEGCNARTWVHVQVEEALTVSKRTQLFTRLDRLANTTVIPYDSPEYYEALAQQVKVFETMHDARLYPEHNEIHFYTELGHAAAVTHGALSAVLLDQDPTGQQRVLDQLYVGQILVFEQVKNTDTGEAIGADPVYRHAVRLTDVSRDTVNGTPVVIIQWADEDAPTFDLPIAITAPNGFIADLCIVRGNIILADHGQTIQHEALPEVLTGVRYRPMIKNVGLTYCVPGNYDPLELASAGAALTQDVRQALPAIALFELSRTVSLSTALDSLTAINRSNVADFAQTLQADGVFVGQDPELTPVRGVGLQIRDRVQQQHLVAEQTDDQTLIKYYSKWTVRPDLLSSGPLSTDYIVDVEEDGHAYLRFGFNGRGRLPQPGDRFVASYRIGTGAGGNVRADTLAHIVTTDTRITQVRNLLPAQGGTDREAVEDAQLFAPSAFQLQARCVTEDDYTTLVVQHPEVVGAVTRVQHVGSWQTAFIYVQRRQGRPIDVTFQTQLARYLEPYRINRLRNRTSSAEFRRARCGANRDVKTRVCRQRCGQRGLRGAKQHPDGFLSDRSVYVWAERLCQSNYRASVDRARRGAS